MHHYLDLAGEPIEQRLRQRRIRSDRIVHARHAARADVPFAGAAMIVPFADVAVPTVKPVPANTVPPMLTASAPLTPSPPTVMPETAEVRSSTPPMVTAATPSPPTLLGEFGPRFDPHLRLFHSRST
jgi:hypothetical protein